jgi:hypothetical protein
MKTAELTIQLPIEELNFLRQYAQRHKITISELVDRYVKELQESQKCELHPDIRRFSGIIPKDIDSHKMFYEHIMEKHK